MSVNILTCFCSAILIFQSAGQMKQDWVFGTRCVTVWACILQVLPSAGKMEICHLSEMMIQDRNINVLKIIQDINRGFCPLWASYAKHKSRPAAALYFKRREIENHTRLFKTQATSCSHENKIQ